MKEYSIADSFAANIKKCAEEKILSKSAALNDFVRDHRNYVHMKIEFRTKMPLTKSTATAAVSAMFHLIESI